MDRKRTGNGNPNFEQRSQNPRFSRPPRPAGSFIQDVYNTSGRRLGKFTSFRILMSSAYAGAFMTIAALLSIVLMSGTTSLGGQVILMSLGLTTGFILLLLTDSILFTEANIFIPYNFFNATPGQASVKLLRFWWLSWLGNVIGALIIAFLIALTQVYSESFRGVLYNVIVEKMLGGHGTRFHSYLELILSGMLANWIMSLAAFFATASRNLINQFVLILLAFIIIDAANFQYFPVNLGYFTLNMFTGKPIGWDLIFMNLIPVSIGNALGGALLVGWPMLYISKR